MPYVPADRRPVIRPHSTAIAQTEGELNFQVTCLVVDYLQQHGLSYERIGDVTGALTNAAQEFYRRVAGPYEDEKIEKNGDVYPPDLLT